MKVRKKPVVVEAIKFDPSKPWNEQGVIAVGTLNEPMIATLEGQMLVRPGDWIITGVQGEKYPCKPDIFAATYDLLICCRCKHEDEDHHDEGPCGAEDCTCAGYVDL